MPSPNFFRRSPVLPIVLPITRLSVLVPRRWMPSSPIVSTVRSWMTLPVTPSATRPFCPLRIVKPTSRQ